MPSGAEQSPDDENITEQLAAIQELWLAAITGVNDASESNDEVQLLAAKKFYAVTIKARLDWEEAGTGQTFEDTYKAKRANALWNEGLAWDAEQRNLPAAAPMTWDYAAWDDFFHRHIWPDISYRGGAPKSGLDIARRLRDGTAWFDR